MAQWSIAAVLVHILCLKCTVVEGNGRGPIGLWAVSDRFIVVADSSLPGLVVVDRKFDVPVERRVLDGVDATSFASCGSCKYGVLTASGGVMVLLYFEEDVQTILHNYAKAEAQAALEAPAGTTPKLVPLNFLQNARVEHVTSYTKQVVHDGRQVIIHPDGRFGFLAASHDHAVFKMEITPEEGDGSSLYVNVTKFLRARKAMDPYGVSFVDGGKNILVTIHHQWIWRVDAETAEIRAKYSAQACAPSAASQRQAIDDPTTDSALLVLASVPDSYDGVLWRLRYGPPSSEEDAASLKMTAITCQVLAGAPKRGPGWIDVLPPALTSNNDDGNANGQDEDEPPRGAAMKLSRAHHFVVVDRESDTDDVTLLASDIDNRALRILQLNSQGLTSSSSIMYNQDYRITREIPTQLRGGNLRGGGIAGSRKSLPSCTAVEEDSAWSLRNGGMLHTYSVLGTPSLLRPASLDPGFSTQLSFREARGYCSYMGGRLCDPSELARTEVSGASSASWTYGECASCWQATEESTCNGIISNERTKGKNRNNHSAAHFHHSWNDGNAIFYKGETFCPGHAQILADAPCCRDCRTSSGKEEDDEDE